MHNNDARLFPVVISPLLRRACREFQHSLQRLFALDPYSLWGSAHRLVYQHRSSGGRERRDDDVAWHVVVALCIVLLSNARLQLRLDDALDAATDFDHTVEVGAQRTMDEVSVALWDRSLANIVAHLDVAFRLPGGARLLKTGMQQRNDELPSPFERGNAGMKRRQIIRDIHQHHIGDYSIKGVGHRLPGREIRLQAANPQRFALFPLACAGIEGIRWLKARDLRSLLRQQATEIALPASGIENPFPAHLS